MYVVVGLIGFATVVCVLGMLIGQAIQRAEQRAIEQEKTKE